MYHRGFITAVSLASFGLAGGIFQHIVYRVGNARIKGKTQEERGPRVPEKFVL